MTNKQITKAFRLSPKENDLLNNLSQREGINPSEYLRNMILNQDRAFTLSPDEVSAFKSNFADLTKITATLNQIVFFISKDYFTLSQEGDSLSQEGDSLSQEGDSLSQEGDSLSQDETSISQENTNPSQQPDSSINPLSPKELQQAESLAFQGELLALIGDIKEIVTQTNNQIVKLLQKTT